MTPLGHAAGLASSTIHGGAVPLHETALALLLLLRPLRRLKESQQTALLNKLEDGGFVNTFRRKNRPARAACRSSCSCAVPTDV